jgi:hypothetical protein
MLRGLVTYYVLFFIHLESRRVDIAGTSPPIRTSHGCSRSPVMSPWTDAAS